MKYSRVIIPQTEDEKKLRKQLFVGQKLFYENKLGEFKAVTICDVKIKFFFVSDDNNKVMRCSMAGSKLRGAGLKAIRDLQIWHHSNELFLSMEDLKQNIANKLTMCENENILYRINRKIEALDTLLDTEKIKAIYEFVDKL